MTRNRLCRGFVATQHLSTPRLLALAEGLA